MSRRRTATLYAASLVIIIAAGLAGRASTAHPLPDFNGTWELDQSRSHSIPPDMKQTMTVVREGDKLTVETKIVTKQGERIIRDAYTLDGKESAFTPPPPPTPSSQQASQQPANAPAAKGKRTGRWLPNGAGFVVEEEVTTETPQGKSVSNIARKWIIWPDGTLSIEIQTENERGSFSNKRIFVKK